MRRLILSRLDVLPLRQARHSYKRSIRTLWQSKVVSGTRGNALHSAVPVALACSACLSDPEICSGTEHVTFLARWLRVWKILKDNEHLCVSDRIVFQVVANYLLYLLLFILIYIIYYITCVFFPKSNSPQALKRCMISRGRDSMRDTERCTCQWALQKSVEAVRFCCKSTWTRPGISE